MHLAALLPFVALPLSLAKNIPIGVGERGLVFNPEVVTADVGDLLQFYFYPKNHSVAQGSFSTPCQPLAGGVYSGFMPVTAEGKTVFEVTVNNTDAIYLYCSQIEHCQNGMSMVVNPPSTGNTLAAYKTAAKNTTSVSPRTIAGGVFMEATGNSTSASNTTSSSTTTPTPSPTAFQGRAAGNGFGQSDMLNWIGISGLVLAMI